MSPVFRAGTHTHAHPRSHTRSGTRVRPLALTPAVPALALALFLAACTASPRQDPSPQDRGTGSAPLAGRWILCLTEATRDTGRYCGPLTATQREADNAPAYYQLEHDAPLDSLLGTAGPHPRFGVLAPADGGRWRLLLDVEEGTTMVYDAGMHGEVAGDTDSLSGTWSLMCFAGCAEHGTAVLKR